MPAIVLVGAQWGDEGKGKATDLLGDRVDYVVRYQGGNNAGHTVVIGEESYALHMLPSGVLTPGVIPVIGNGVVIDPQVLLEEVDALTARVGIRVQDLFDPGILRQKLELVLREKNQILGKVYNRRGIDPQACAEEYLHYAERLRPYVADTGLILGRALDRGRVVLLEG